MFQHAVADAQSQLDGLVGPDFLTAAPWQWLSHFPRYFRAVQVRFDKLRSGSLDRDRRHTQEIAARVAAFRERTGQHAETIVPDPELIHYRWMLEEYRVSVFAQRLGTSLPVSSKRLDRQWSKRRDVPAP